MAVKEQLDQLFGLDISDLQIGDPIGSVSRSGVRYQLEPLGYHPMVVVRVDNTTDLSSIGLLSKPFSSGCMYGVVQVVADPTEPERISKIRQLFHKTPVVDDGINKN